METKTKKYTAKNVLTELALTALILAALLTMDRCIESMHFYTLYGTGYKFWDIFMALYLRTQAAMKYFIPAAFAVWLIARRGRFHAGVLPAILLFYLCTALTTLFSEGGASFRIGNTMQYPLAMLLFATMACASRRGARRFTAAATGLYIVLLGLNLAFALWPQLYFAIGTWQAEYLIAPDNLTGYPMFFALLCALLDRHLGGARARTALYLLLFFANLALIHCASAMLGCVPVALYLIFPRVRKAAERLSLNVFSALAAAFFAVLMLCAYGYFHWEGFEGLLAGVIAIEASMLVRFIIWNGSLTLALQKPLFGHGLGTEAEFFYRPNTSLNYHAHNAVLQTLQEGGLVTLAAAGLVLTRTAKALKESRDRELAGIFKILIFGELLMMQTAIEGWFPWYPVFLMAQMAAVTAAIDEEEDRSIAAWGRGLFSRKDVTRLAAVLAVLALIALLVPMLKIAEYDVPSADDFSFSCETYRALQTGEGLLGALRGAAEKAGKVYTSWQGTFAAIVLMAFQPGIFGLAAYRATAWITLGGLLGGIFWFSVRLYHDVFSCRKATALLFAAAAGIGCTQALPGALQGFYWYNGGIYYTFTFGMLLFAFACGISLLRKGGGGRIALLCFFGILLGGGNYVTALFACVSLALLLFALLLRRDGRWKRFALPGCVLLAAFALSVLAPGNAVRQAEVPEHPGAVSAVLLSVKMCAEQCVTWALDGRYLAVMAALLPFAWSAARGCRCRFRLPLAVTALSFLLHASMFTPQIYAMGILGPERLVNILYYAFLLLSVFNLFWWCGALNELVGKKRSEGDSVSPLPALACGLCALALLAGAVKVQGKGLTAVIALSSLRSGEAETYYAEALERQSVLEDDAVRECEFAPYTEQPLLLYFSDLSDSMEDYQNEDCCTFYGKSSILVR